MHIYPMRCLYLDVPYRCTYLLLNHQVLHRIVLSIVDTTRFATDNETSYDNNTDHQSSLCVT